LKIPPLGEILQQGFIAFVDEKDPLLSLTPIYLLCGLSLPLWMPTNNLTLMVLLSGVLTVGIGDTAASFVGNRWGAHKWPDTEKTIEGTIACIFCQVCIIFTLTCCGRFRFLYLPNSFFHKTVLFIFNYVLPGLMDNYRLLLRSILSAVSISLIEARTNQVDNLALPLLMYVCLMV